MNLKTKDFLCVQEKNTFRYEQLGILSNEKVHRECSMKNWEQSYESHASPLSAVGGFHYTQNAFHLKQIFNRFSYTYLCISYVLVVSGKQKKARIPNSETIDDYFATGTHQGFGRPQCVYIHVYVYIMYIWVFQK